MYNEPSQAHFLKRDGIIQKYTKGYSGTDYSTWQIAKYVHTDHTGSLSFVGGQIKIELLPEVKCRGQDRLMKVFLAPRHILKFDNVKQVNYLS